MEQNGGAATAENQVEDSGAGSIKIKVSYGNLKRVIAKETGLEPEVQNLLLREKEKDDQETLHMSGVKENAKVILMENAPIKEEDVEKVEEIEESIEPIEEISRGVEAVSHIREENNEFAEQVRRVQGLIDKLNDLKAKNSNISTDIPKTASREPSTPSPKVTQEWEVFE